jgi:hypothetical protein
MPPSGDLSSGRIVAYLIWLGVCLLIPVVLAAGARRRLGAGWKYFGFGVLVGLVLLAVGRVMVRSYFPRVVALPLLGPSESMLLVGFYFAALVELGRYVGFLRLIQVEERKWDNAVVYGLGTGAASVVIWSSDMLLGWTLLCGIAVHVALSVLVLQAFRRGGLRWIWLAILANMLWHVGPDLLRMSIGSVLIVLMQWDPQSAGSAFTPGDTVTIAANGVLGLAALWMIYSLRERPKATTE